MIRPVPALSGTRRMPLWARDLLAGPAGVFIPVAGPRAGPLVAAGAFW